METVSAQQHTIEVLTIKLEETNAKLEKANARIAELEEQLHNPRIIRPGIFQE